jgi:hypothetical protein
MLALSAQWLGAFNCSVARSTACTQLHQRSGRSVLVVASCDVRSLHTDRIAVVVLCMCAISLRSAV